MKIKGLMRFLNILKENLIFSILLILLIILSMIFPWEIINYPYYVHWKTIFSLTGLLFVTTSMKESGYFGLIAKGLLKRIRNERKLAMFFITFSIILSTFLTNDISLFIVIPLTLSFREIIENDLTKLIIFEAIAVNVGSALTPIGNPQNLYLWHRWNIHFFQFILKMLPFEIFLIVVLIIFAHFCFSNKELLVSEKENNFYSSKKLFFFSSILLIFYLICLELKFISGGLILIILLYLIFYRKIFTKVDWMLLIIFILIFIDFHLISEISIINRNLSNINLSSFKNTFLISALISQVISNVPAAVLISKFSHNWKAIVYGVNIGGNGIVISSLANIIALRIAGDKKIWLHFHKYSMVYFLITFLSIYQIIVKSF